jgi:hypothetical protein
MTPSFFIVGPGCESFRFRADGLASEPLRGVRWVLALTCH